MTIVRLSGVCIFCVLFLPLVVGIDLQLHQWFNTSNLRTVDHHDICRSTGTPAVKILPLGAFPLFNTVEYLVRHDMRFRPEVRDMNLTYSSFYAHVYQAFSLVNRNKLSLAAVNANTEEVIGVNLVLRFPQLAKMYAPGPIYEVLRFVRQCYASEMGSDVDKVWIRILEGSDTKFVHCELLKKASRRYFHLPSKERHGMLLWASAKQQGALLAKLGYKLLVCGGSGGPCDWTRLKIPKSVADDICLFALD